MSSRFPCNYSSFSLFSLAILLAFGSKPVQGSSLRKPRMIWQNFEKEPELKLPLPVKIDMTQLNETETETIENGLTELMCKTCLEFVIVDESDTYDPFAIVLNRTTGIGYSYAQGNIVSYEELTRNTIIHEILHAMGAAHTMRRPDRDEYIKMKPAKAKGFNFEDVEKIVKDGLTFGLPYEYDSVMHYPNDERYEVLKEPKAENQAKMGRGLSLTANDVKSIQAAYCDNKTDTFLEPDSQNCTKQAEALKVEEADLKAKGLIPDKAKISNGTTENDAIVEAQEPTANTTEDGGSGDDGEAMESESFTTVDPETAGAEAEGSGEGDSAQPTNEEGEGAASVSSNATETKTAEDLTRI